MGDVCSVQVVRVGWDSDNFGFEVGRIVLDWNNLSASDLEKFVYEAVSEATKQRLSLLYLSLPKDMFLETEKFRPTKILLADRKVVYHKEISGQNLCLPAVDIHSYSLEEASDSLLNLAFESGRYSRYKTDPDFPDNVFEKMYSVWMKRSVKKEIADDVIVCEDQGMLKGMITYKVEAEVATVGLVAVDAACRGQHVGTQLIGNLEHLLFLQGLRVIEVATQMENRPACQFYTKNGYVVKQITNIYHIWL